MVHPKPADEAPQGLLWLADRQAVRRRRAAGGDRRVRGVEARARRRALPDVPFEWLTAFPLTAEQWAELAGRMGWQALRMNLNTLARNGAFGVDGVAEMVAARLADREAIAQGAAPALPADGGARLGRRGRAAQGAGGARGGAGGSRSRGVPKVPGRVVVCPDVSGSMSSPVTGYRKGASSKVRCIDVAALVAAAVLRRNREAPGAAVRVRRRADRARSVSRGSRSMRRSWRRSAAAGPTSRRRWRCSTASGRRSIWW